MKAEITKGLFAVRALPLMLLALCMQGCVTSKNLAEREYYTKANIWYTNPKLIKSTNYHMGAMIPFGTKVSIEQLDGSQIVFHGPGNLSCKMLRVRKHSTISMEDLFNRYFSASDPMAKDGLFDHFTGVEKENLLKGNIVEQMSKEAVLASYGYPPSHTTVDLNQDYWRYWVAGRQEIWVSFLNNKVQSIEMVSISGPPPGRKQITKVSSLIQ